MSIANELKRTTLKTAFHYLEKDPEKNAVKLMDLVDKICREAVRTASRSKEKRFAMYWKIRRIICIS